MWQLVFQSLWRKIGQNTLITSGFFLTACALIILSTTTLTTTLRTKQIINQNWRPMYDLVVLPPQAHIPQGQAIPSNLFEGYQGGISVQQYHQIQQIPGVTLAAPIAFLGYVQLPSPFVEFSSHPFPPGYYRIDWTLSAFNGIQTIIERRVSLIYYLSASCNVLNRGDAFFKALKQENVIFWGCGSIQTGVNSLPSIDTGTFLLAAIDPAAENQLVGLGKSVVSGRMLTNQDTLQTDVQQPTLTDPSSGIDSPNYDVPLLFHQQLPGQIHLTANFARVISDSLDLQKVLNQGGIHYLSQIPEQQQIFNGAIPLVQNDPQRFSNSDLSWNGHSWQARSASIGGNTLSFLYTPSPLTYQTATAPDGQKQPAYTLVPSNIQNAGTVLDNLHLHTDILPSGQQGPEVAFRTLEPTSIIKTSQPPYVSAYYTSKQIGQFSDTELIAQFSNNLNWLPETTYTTAPIVLRYDRQGKSISPKNLLPTTNAASFMLQPPLALTTLAAAERIAGKKCISIIRIRVAGVTGANATSWQKVAQIAQSIEQRTGLHAVVTLGSSPQPTLVYVPGIKKGQDGSVLDIAPIGWVEDRWIVLGAGLIYLNQSNSTQLLLLSSLLIVCFGYIIITLSTLFSTRHREFAVLNALGWHPRQLVQLFLSHVLILSLLGGSSGIGLALALVASIGASPPWLLVVWTLPIVLALALLSAIYPLWQLNRIHPAELLRAGASVTDERTGGILARLATRLPTIGGFSLRNLLRSRARSLIALLSLLLSAVLLMVMLDGLLAFRQTLQGTLLGNYVLFQTAVPQVAGAAFAILLTFMSVADLLLLQVRERQREIGLLQAVGWRLGMVQRLFVQEGLTLALVGTIPGVLIATAILIAQHATQHLVPLPALGIGTILLMLVVATLATLPALRATRRMSLTDVMRAE